MARKAITITVVDELEPGEVIWDTKVAGFGVRRQKTARVYVLKRRIGGQQRWMAIGQHGSPWTPEKARKRARVLLGEISSGGDPAVLRDQEKASGTFEDLAQRYLAEHAKVHKKPRSVEGDETNLRLNILPSLGKRRITQITRSDIAKLHHGLREKPGAANRCLALLSKMFSLSEKWGLRPEGSNPVRHIDRFPERKIERYLTADELGRLGAVLQRAEKERIMPVPPTKRGRGMRPRTKGENPYLIAAIRLLLFTGARRSEILSAKWEWFDRDRAALFLPVSKTGAKMIALGEPALLVLKGLPVVKRNPYILPGHVRGTHLLNVDKFWRRVCALAEVRACRIHDLRHSFASVGAAGGSSLFLIGKLLGHSQPQTTQRYAHLGDDPMKAAVDRISSTIAAALATKAPRTRRKKASV
jgi:integrase